MRTVGELLKEERLKKNLTLEEVERAVKIRKGILADLESGNWKNLPPTYTKGLLKNYGSFLGLDEKRVLAFYRREFDEQKAPVLSTKAPKKTRRFTLTPSLVTAFLISSVTTIILIYLFVQYQSFTAAPKLEIQEPGDNIKTTTQEVNVVGQTWSDSIVKINGEEVQVSPGGSFSVSVGLKEGINKLTITSANRFGKISTITRTVAVEAQSQVNSSSGLNIVLEAVNQSVLVTVEADGTQVFEGLILSGSKKSFSAKKLIKVKSSDGGATKVKIGDQELTLGNSGEAAEKEFTP